MRCVNNNNFDIAIGYINASIEKSASDEEDLTPLYLIKSAALLGWIGESKESVILTNLPDAPVGKLPDLLKGQMSPILKYLEGIQELVRRMAQIDDSELIYKGPWVRSAQQGLSKPLKPIMAFRWRRVVLW